MTNVEAIHLLQDIEASGNTRGRGAVIRDPRTGHFHVAVTIEMRNHLFTSRREWDTFTANL